MATQHDFNIADQAGGSFLGDLNNALIAAVRNSEGDTEPSVTHKFQFWADTITGKLKIRNAANNDWVEIGILADPNLGLALIGAVNTFAELQTFAKGIKFTGTGGIQGAKSTVAAHASTMAVFDGAGTVQITGATPLEITDFKDAPQTGMWRKVISDAAHTLKNSATLVVQGGKDYVLRAGEIFWVYSSTIAIFHVFTFAGDFASAAENAAGVLENRPVDPLGIREALNATGLAPVYASRAWVNFNAAGAMLGAANVSSVTKHAGGDFTINFTNAMPTANYAVALATQVIASGGHQANDNQFVVIYNGAGKLAGSLRINTQYGNLNGGSDHNQITVAIFH